MDPGGAGGECGPHPSNTQVRLWAGDDSGQGSPRKVTVNQLCHLPLWSTGHHVSPLNPTPSSPVPRGVRHRYTLCRSSRTRRRKELGILCFITLPFIALHSCCVVLLVEDKTLHPQKDYNSVYCDTRFIAKVWNRTQNVCLY